jgi:hypothetical protein
MHLLTRAHFNQGATAKSFSDDHSFLWVSAAQHDAANTQVQLSGSSNAPRKPSGLSGIEAIRSKASGRRSMRCPGARSGQGIAWDGLSRFDLSRYNPWYFERHKQFARRAAEKGFLILYNLYNTHDVLEIGPHWIDFPWRPANNINDTGLPEPPPFKPHNRNDVGNEFYSTTYAPLRELHRAYMLHTFDELADQPNIIFEMAYQYADPLEFEQFFQHVAREWEAKHGKHIRIALTTSKQTTDAILADPLRSKQIAIVDMRYWEYRPDGSLFAPRRRKSRLSRADHQ